ncbi:MAG: LuxR C-terminal-related transcriptional regulator [Massilia sp.]
MNAAAETAGHLDSAVILSNREQEYLIGAIEAAVRVRDLRQLFLWTQGQLQALLPHRLMLCIQLDEAGSVLRTDPVHAGLLDAATLRALTDPLAGLAARIAAQCRASERLPSISGAGRRSGDATLGALRRELQQLGFDHLVVHGSGAVAGPATLFALCGWQAPPTARHAHFLALLLPHLHLALLKSATGPRDPSSGASAGIARPLSAREIEILGWVREGKSNFEVGLILGLSPITIKNHLQRIYRTLGVSNRTHALARCLTLQILS